MLLLGEIIIDKATVQHLLVVADMLQLRELVTGCGEYLKRELHASNALGIYRYFFLIQSLKVKKHFFLKTGHHI